MYVAIPRNMCPRHISWKIYDFTMLKVRLLWCHNLKIVLCVKRDLNALESPITDILAPNSLDTDIKSNKKQDASLLLSPYHHIQTKGKMENITLAVTVEWTGGVQPVCGPLYKLLIIKLNVEPFSRSYLNIHFITNVLVFQAQCHKPPLVRTSRH